MKRRGKKSMRVVCATETRREAVYSLIRLGLTPGDIAQAMGVEKGTVISDLKKVLRIKLVMDLDSVPQDERRHLVFRYALSTYVELMYNPEDSDEVRTQRGQDKASLMIQTLGKYIGIEEINGVFEGVASTIRELIHAVDPPEYRVYRDLLIEVFGSKNFNDVSLEGFFMGFYKGCCGFINTNITRESLHGHVACWASYAYLRFFTLPLSSDVCKIIDDVVATISDRNARSAVAVRFSLLCPAVTSQDRDNIFKLSLAYRRALVGTGLRELRQDNRRNHLQLLIRSPYTVMEEVLGKIPLFSTDTGTPVYMVTANPSPTSDGVVDIGPLLVLTVEDEEIGFPMRAKNALKNAGIKTIGNLVQKAREDVVKVHNMGEKTISSVEEILKACGLYFGMKIVDGRVVPPSPIFMKPAE